MKIPFKKQKVTFPSFDSLTPVKKLLEETAEALSEKTKVWTIDPLSDSLGAGGGGLVSVGALSALGTVSGLSASGITSGLAAAGTIVGGGMVSGIFVLGALPFIGVYAVRRCNSKRLRRAKGLLLQEAVRIRGTVIRDLKEQADKSKEWAERLEKLNHLLQAAVDDLQKDMAIENEQEGKKSSEF